MRPACLLRRRTTVVPEILVLHMWVRLLPAKPFPVVQSVSTAVSDAADSRSSRDGEAIICLSNLVADASSTTRFFLRIRFEVTPFEAWPSFVPVFLLVRSHGDCVTNTLRKRFLI